MNNSFNAARMNPLQRIGFIMLDGMIRKFVELTGGGIWIVTAIPVAKDRVEMVTLGTGCQCPDCLKMTKDLLPQLQDVAVKALTERHGGDYTFSTSDDTPTDERPCLPDCSEDH